MVGKKLLLVATMVLALPIAALADSDTIFTNNGGTLSGTDAGLSLTGSTLVGMSDPEGSYNGANLGSVTFTTGGLSSGSLQSGGTFGMGGSFTITGNGSNGVSTGLLFSGAFAQPPVWTMSTTFNGTHQYTLTGVLSGTLAGGAAANDVNVTLTINTGRGFFNSSAPFYGGTTVTTVPEPDSWALLATALLGIAVVFPRKWKMPARTGSPRVAHREARYQARTLETR